MHAPIRSLTNLLLHPLVLTASLLLVTVAAADAGPRDKRAAKDRADQASRSTDRDAAKSFQVPEPNPQQQANLQELRGSLSVLANGAQAADDEIRDLAQDLQGMALHPPDAALTRPWPPTSPTPWPTPRCRPRRWRS